MEQPPILVTGASGFIGKHVLRHLVCRSHHVTALDFRPPGDPFPEGVRHFRCDIRTDPFPKQSFDAVVHLAALAGVRPSIDRPSTTSRPTSASPCACWTSAGSLEARLAEHNRGESPVTKPFVPWEIEVALAFREKAKAVAFEAYLKSHSGRSFSKRHF